MKIAILGAGAIGAMLTAILKEAGHDPLLIARGKTRDALLANGLTFIEGEHTSLTYPRISDDPSREGPQDLVIIAVKAHQIEDALPAILPLIGKNSRILTAINGMPWWFFQEMSGPYRNRTLHTVDPDHRLAGAFDPRQLIGCAVYLASSITPPYSVISTGLRKLVCGPVSPENQDILDDIAPLFDHAGMPMPVSRDIRAEVMSKLMGNLWANPLSVLTGATMKELSGFETVLNIGRKMMEEFEILCERLNITLPVDIETRLEKSRDLGDFKTSMLQDYEKSRAIELDAILGAPIEAAEWIGCPHDTMRRVYDLTYLKAQNLVKLQKPVSLA